MQLLLQPPPLLLPTLTSPPSYLRVGPNPKFDFTGQPYHTFDGDGFIHSVTFTEGRDPSYVKRWVRTRRLITSEMRGFDVGEMGEQALGSFDYFEHVTDRIMPGHDREDSHRMGKANTNLVSYNNRVFALEEQDKPYEIVASWDLDSHLRTVGRFDFDKKLHHPVTAHPKVDPETGEMMFFGYDPLSPRVTYSVGSKDGKLLRSLEIPLPAPVMMHDMVITKHYSLLFDMRMEFSMEAVTEGKNPWKHRRDLPARFGVLPRHATSPDEIKWYEVSPCAVFHFANAWEEEETGQIVVVGCRLPTVNFTRFEDEITSSDEKFKKSGEYAVLFEWRLDLKKGKCVSERIISNHHCDFVQVDPCRLGRKTKFAYAQRFISDVDKIPEQYRASLYLIDGFLKYDLQNNTVTEFTYKSLQGGTQMYGTEGVFARRETRNDEDPKQEDSGYLVVFIHNEETNLSECLMLKAEDLTVQVRVAVPERVPFGFHGTWVDGRLMR